MNLSELLQSKALIDRQIADVRSKQRSAAIAEILELMTLHGLAYSDIATSQRGVRTASPKTKRPVAAKYRDDAGNHWSGRGLKPKWLILAISQGRRPEDFLI